MLYLNTTKQDIFGIDYQLFNVDILDLNRLDIFY